MTKDKRFLIVPILILIFVFSVISIQLFNHAYNSYSRPNLIVSNAYETSRGARFDIDVFLKQTDDLAGGFIELEFDNEVLSVMDEIRYSSFLDEFLLSSNVIKEEGKIKIAFVSGVGSDISGKLFSIPFRLNVRNGKSDIKVTNLELLDSEGKNLRVRKHDGFVGAFNGIDLGKVEDVSKDQKWNIRFNYPLKFKSVNEQTVKLLRYDSGEIIDTDVLLLEDDIIQIEPKKDYDPGIYQIIVTRRVMSEMGRFSTNPVRLRFRVN